MTRMENPGRIGVLTINWVAGSSGIIGSYLHVHAMDLSLDTPPSFLQHGEGNVHVAAGLAFGTFIQKGTLGLESLGFWQCTGKISHVMAQYFRRAVDSALQLHVRM